MNLQAKEHQTSKISASSCKSILLSKLYATCIYICLTLTVNLSAAGYTLFINEYISCRYRMSYGLPCGNKMSSGGCNPNNITEDTNDTFYNEALKRSARLLSFISVTPLILGIFSSLLVGARSDRLGRRLTIGIIILGHSLSNITTTTFVLVGNLPVEAFLLGPILSGLIGGGHVAFNVLVTVCFTDLTRIQPPSTPDSATFVDDRDSAISLAQQYNRQESRRLILLGCVDATLTLATGIGSALTGTFVKNLDFTITALVLLGISSLSAILLWLLPETAPVIANQVNSEKSDGGPTTPRSIASPSPTIALIERNREDGEVEQQPVSENKESITISEILARVLGKHKPIVKKKSTCFHFSKLCTCFSWIFKPTTIWITVLAVTMQFLYLLIICGEGNILYLYLTAKPFCWEGDFYGTYTLINQIMMTSLSLTLTGLMAWSLRGTQIIAITTDDPLSPRRSTFGNLSPLSPITPFFSDCGSIVSRFTYRDEEVMSAGGTIKQIPSLLAGSSLTLNYIVGEQSVLPIQIPRSQIWMILCIVFGYLALLSNKLIMGLAFKLVRPSDTIVVFVALLLGSFRAPVLPVLKAFISSVNMNSRQDRLFSVIGICDLTAIFIGTLATPNIYGSTVSMFPGAVFLLVAGLASLGLAVGLVLLHSAYRIFKLSRNTNQITSSQCPRIN